MIHPNWAQALSATGKRRRITLFLQGEPISLELVGETTVGIVRTQHMGRDLRPRDVIWIKEMAADGITILDFQFFPEGLPGVARGTERVALVERGKGEALAQSATDLPVSLVDLLEAANDEELGPLFSAHLALVELFITARPETAERLKNENPRKVKAMLQRCLTLKDATGRRNPHSKVLGVKSATKRLRAMSARRMVTASAAFTTSLTLNALMHAMYALVIEVDTEITSKLGANTWDLGNPSHRRWLKRFAARCTTWAQEFENMDMHPFARSAKEAQYHLERAATLMEDSLPATNVPQIQSELRRVLVAVRTLIARFKVAEMLRIVGTARDERMKQLGIVVAEPVWTEIQTAIAMARDTFGITETPFAPVHSLVEDPRITQAYVTLRSIAKFYDTASRTTAA